MYTNVSVCEEGSVDQGFGLMINTLPFADSNEEYMENFLVIFLSLKGVDGLTFFVMHWFDSGCSWSKFVLK